MRFTFIWRVIKASILLDTAYRSGFFFAIFARAVWIAMFVATYAVIYTQVDHLVGYSFDDSMVYYATFVLMEQLLFAVFGRSLTDLPNLIHHGGLDQVLVRPVDSQAYLSFRSLHFFNLVSCVVPAALLAYFVQRSPHAFSLWYLPLFLVAFFGLYALWSLVMSVAFAASNLPELQELFLNFLRMVQFPPQIYAGALGVFLYGVFPVATLMLLPVRAIFDPTNMPRVLLTGTLVAAALLLVSRLVWQLGLRSYASAS